MAHNMDEKMVKVSLENKRANSNGAEVYNAFELKTIFETNEENIAKNETNEPKNKFKIALMTILKIITLLGLLYLFVCSLDFLSSAFRLIGSRAAGRIISESDLLKNPVVGLMIGVLVTVLFQSSSTSTSIVVTMVASNIIRVREAIPIVMGANIGTSVTNTIVSLMQSNDRNEFRLAFAAATVHDMFNWLTVIVLLPVEALTHYLELVTGQLMSGKWHTTDSQHAEFLGRLTKPLTNLVVQLDKKVLNQLAFSTNVTKPMIKSGQSLLSRLHLSDSISGLALLILSLLMLCVCLLLMVKVLHSMLRGQIALVIKKTMNRNYRFPYSLFVDYFAIIVGCVLTILVQSSSVFTSALTPLAGVGVISLERIYPLTLGANMGTTTTGILAALAADSKSLQNTLQLAFCHLLFNVTGIILFYPLPFMRWPIGMARTLGRTTAKYRWFSVFYLIAMFFLLPLLVFGLSLAGPWFLVAIGAPFLSLFILIILINVIQINKPKLLPSFLKTWDFLPHCLHSLEPIDRIAVKLRQKLTCLKRTSTDYSAETHL